MAINIDLSKVLHPRFLDIAAALMPGLFFECCLLLANPPLVLSFNKPPINPPLAVVVALLLAFFVGNILMFWTTYLHRPIYWLIRVGQLTWRPLQKKTLKRLLRAKGNPPRPSWFAKSGTLNLAYHRAMTADHRFQKVARNWEKVAKRVFKIYDVELPDDNDSWTAWVGVIGRFKPEDFRGHIMVVATAATGWSGLVAMHFAPQLHRRYFWVFCLFSIGIGIFNGVRVSYLLASPERSWGLGTMRAFDELKQASICKMEANEKSADKEQLG